MFIGSDDFLKPNALQLYKEFIEKHVLTDCLYISSKNEIIDSNKNIIRIYGWPWLWKTFKRRNNISHPGSLHSYKLFKNYGMYDENYKIAGDYELLLRPKEKLNAMFLNEITMQVTQGGVSSNPQMFEEHYNAVVNTAKTSKLLAIYDFYVQYMKMFLKNFFMNYGIHLKYKKEY